MVSISMVYLCIDLLYWKLTELALSNNAEDSLEYYVLIKKPFGYHVRVATIIWLYFLY